MRIMNRSKVVQAFDGVTLQPGEAYDSGDSIVKTAVAGDLGTLRAEYRELTGKDADRRWKEDRIRSEIDKALAE